MPGALSEILSILAADPACSGETLDRVAALVGQAAGTDCAIYVRPLAGSGFARRAARGAAFATPHAAELPLGRDDALRERLDSGAPVRPARDADADAWQRRLGAERARLVPLCSAGSCIGLLGLESDGDNGDQALITDAATALGLALGAARFRRGLRDRVRALDARARDLDVLAEVARRITAPAAEREVADIVASEARRLAVADMAVLFTRDDVGRLDPVGADGWGTGEPAPAVIGMAARNIDTPIWLGRELAVPLAGPAHTQPAVRGLLVVCRRGGEPFDDADIERVSDLARHAAVALDNARLLGRLRRERAERHALAAALVNAQEGERRRVAEDIHDGPVQELVGVSLLLDALAAELAGDHPDLHREAQRAADRARGALRGLRRAILDLHPMVLDELGFAAAVRGLVRRLEWQEVDVEVDVGPAEQLSAPLRAVAFRTCQEAVANILRHAEAARVVVRAHRDGPALAIEIRDDGRGFDPDQTARGLDEGHIGLSALRERAALVGGDLQVLSSAGAGTTLRLTLPLEGAGAA